MVERVIVDHRVKAVTLTGSEPAGASVASIAAKHIKKAVLELGGSDPFVVMPSANIAEAVSTAVKARIVNNGQSCIAAKRFIVHESIAGDFEKRFVAAMEALKVGDPSRRENWMGPVTTAGAYDNYAKYCERLRDGGKIVAGGFKLRDGELAHGFYVAPTLAEAPATHPLFDEEMFLPILMLCRVKDRDEAMRLTNASALGLTAGCYGNDNDIEFFFDNVEAGVTYANRAQGATTGAWPGYQPFGGWKGSSSTGKGIASFYYLAQYQREQSQTRVE